MTDASDRITSVWQKARVWFLFVVAMAGAAAPTAIGQPVVLSVDARRVLRDGANTFIGINLNYIRDADANRPHARALTAALKDLGVQWLRYPGGEKSDFYLWSTLPYDKPSPVSLGPYKAMRGTRLDFDQYIAEARAIGAEPYVVAGYDSMARTGRTKAQWIESAVAWVRYANVVKKYRVKYWEIGNENWYNGTAEPADMAEIVAEFSHAMKAVDPTIQVGASGNDDAWWSVFLPVAAPHLDFISLSLYNTWAWKGYDRFTRQPPPDLIRNVRKALAAIDRYAPEADRSRLKVVVSETNSKDYSKYGWPATNTLGHALVTFDTLGRLLQQERVLAAMVWTTRWMRDAEARRSQWYALGPNNALLPGISADLLYGFERFILQSHRHLAFTELNIVGTRASADRRDGNVVEGTSPSAFVSFRADNYEVTNSGKITVHIDKGVDCAASTSSNRGSFLGIRNDPRTSAALVLLAARVHPRGQAPGMRFALQTSWTLRSFKRAVATDLSRVAITRGVAGAHVRRLGTRTAGAITHLHRGRIGRGIHHLRTQRRKRHE